VSNLVIVAIPAEDDPVWKVSTEKVPHMTILFLGDVDNVSNLDQITQFLIHAANLELTRFGLDVDRRGELGVDQADVIFFDDRWELPRLREFRHHLLQEPNIRKAYDSVVQYPVWTPHLTLGYPAAPAKDDAVDFPLHWVQFDRIALWDRDFDGFELVLKRDNFDAEVAMSTTRAGADFIAHFGVKGMRWGVRKDQQAVSRDILIKTGHTRVRGKTRVRTKGGSHHDVAGDALEFHVTRQKMKRSGTDALSNVELQKLATRMNLEQQVHALSSKRPKTVGQKAVQELLKDPEKTIKTGTRIARKLSTGV
jgi:2'-5' RNA ligase